MIRLLKWLIFGDGHLHKWEPYGDEVRVFVDPDDIPAGVPSYHKQSFRCAICGVPRRFKV